MSNATQGQGVSHMQTKAYKVFGVGEKRYFLWAPFMNDPQPGLLI